MNLNSKINKTIIVIDPGHGGYESGAHCDGGGREAELNMEVGKLIFFNLTMRPAIIPILTRWGNENLLNYRRMEIADDYEAKQFVSVHHNGSRAQSAHGTEVWYKMDCPQSKRMAEIMQNKLVADLGRYDRGIKLAEPGSRPFTILNPKRRTPGILVETEFVTNPKGIAFIENNIERIASAITMGVMLAI